MRTAQNHQFVSATMNRKQVAARFGHSVTWFDQRRAEMEQRGFPKYDSLLHGWLVVAVERWINKRAQVDDEDAIQEQIALERIAARTNENAQA